MMSGGLSNNGFKFNLLPKKSSRELELTKERDDSILYASGIVFFASIVWVASAMILNLLVLPQKDQINKNIDIVNGQISLFADIQSQHGEEVLKAKDLRPLIDKRVNTDVIFSVAQSIATNAGATGVISYRRDESGRFIFQIVTGDFSVVPQIMQNARGLSNVSNVELQSSVRNVDNNLVTNTIALNINAIN